MLNNFLVHVIISAAIFAILASGFKFFVKLRGTIDFSYMGIVIFGSYVGALLNTHFGFGILAAILVSFIFSIAVTFLVLFLSSKLTDIYFSIGTLALYILVYQLAYNMESITGGALGLPGISRALIGNISLSGIVPFLIFSLIVVGLIFSGLWLLKKSYFYKMLTGWGENEIVLKSLGVKINLYKFTMILITSFLAVVGGNIFAFYYLYIDPSSFWIGMLMIILVISFISYKFNDWGTLLTSVIIILIYEYLRFFKVVDPSKIGYFREIFFGVLIVVVAFVVFRKTSFGRDS